MATNSIDEMLRRPARRSMDGLNEVQFGIVFLLWGGILIALELWGRWLPAWASWSWLGPLLLAGLLPTLARRLRARWIEPRIGYVKIRSGSVTAVIVLGVVVALLAAVALTRSSQFQSPLPAFAGLLWAVATIAAWMRFRLRRLLIYALLTLASGLVAGWSLPARLGVATVMCAVSLFWLIGGVLALRNLMRQSLAAEDQA